ncbi:MBL fold metallo-hydrolase [Streptomyces sp. NBC_00237]|uniref:MBL fold metallo-hydrolase n=1 Tax=Streptomyces sp. NBC_00237 TaxID=2975687 RepID=UPI0022514CE7|nr:MBL fold metallo-hydrolase [Streptomyces sp. NBC_00237]MCX5205095.1 MBL fold metallo-hydrolase [Streptomyces sp. NBC_00237]
MTAPSLRPLSATTWAWVHDRTAWGYSNCGLIASEGEALLVDTQFTLEETRALLAAIDLDVPGAAVTRVVNSHGNGDHTWGNQLIPRAEFITSKASAENLCQEMNPAQLTALSRSPATTPVAAYAAEHFGMFDFSGITVQPPTRTFTGHTTVQVGGVQVELLDLGAGHSHGDVAVHVPDDGVVFTGDAVFNGAHMVVWSDSLRACVTACDTLLGTGAQVFVPGHGRITERSGVIEIRDLLARVLDASVELATAGVGLGEAAYRVREAHGGTLAHPERLFTAVAAAYQDAGVEGVPAGTLPLVEGMAALASA